MLRGLNFPKFNQFLGRSVIKQCSDFNKVDKNERNDLLMHLPWKAKLTFGRLHIFTNCETNLQRCLMCLPFVLCAQCRLGGLILSSYSNIMLSPGDPQKQPEHPCFSQVLCGAQHYSPKHYFSEPRKRCTPTQYLAHVMCRR